MPSLQMANEHDEARLNEILIDFFSPYFFALNFASRSPYIQYSYNFHFQMNKPCTVESY